MKKLMIGSIVSLAVALFADCKPESHDGTYIADWKNEYFMADDTIIIKANIVTKRTGYRKIRNGQLKPKAWSVKKWGLNDPSGPVVELGEHQVTIGNTVYKQIDQ